MQLWTRLPPERPRRARSVLARGWEWVCAACAHYTMGCALGVSHVQAVASGAAVMNQGAVPCSVSAQGTALTELDSNQAVHRQHVGH